MDGAPLLTAHGVGRSFGAVTALRSAAITVSPGRIHALLGENGAGKSTLVRIMAGLDAADTGTVTRRGTVAVVPQQPRFAPTAPLWHNLIAGIEPRLTGRWWSRRVVDSATAIDRLERVASAIDVALPLRGPTHATTGAERRLGALIAALARDPHILIADEPTAGLAPAERTRVLDALRRMAAAGTGVVIVSHDLGEVVAVADDATILQNGATVAHCEAPFSVEELQDRLFAHARRPDSGVPDDIRPTDAPSLLSVSLAGGVHLSVGRGRVIALLSSQDGTAATIDALLTGGLAVAGASVAIDGHELVDRRGHVSPRRARRLGLVAIPADRIERASAGAATITDNAIVVEREAAHPLRLHNRRERGRVTRRVLGRLAVTAPHGAPLDTLSGGTIQRVILGREISGEPIACVLSEPSIGLDIATQRSLAAALREFAREGRAVLIVSTRYDEIVAAADAVAVVCRGVLAGTFPAHDRSSIIAALDRTDVGDGADL